MGNSRDRGKHDRHRQLTFDRYETPAGVSLASLAPDLLDRCGIYILEFDNGDAYVGQTVTILGRFASHRRTWNDIVAIRFAPCHVDLLDELEVAVVQQEQQQRDLRNLLLTRRPAGSSQLEVVVSSGRTIALPWTRSDRASLGDVAESSVEARFWHISDDERYPAIRTVLATYVRDVVPAPVDSQGLWVLTALPGKGGRLFTLTVGDTETLYAGNHDSAVSDFWTVLNVSDDERLPGLLDSCGLDVEHEPAHYALSDHHPVRRIYCEYHADVTTLFEEDWLLDAAHRLAVTLMRRGSSPNRSRHNLGFAADVLRAAWQRNYGAD